MKINELQESLSKYEQSKNRTLESINTLKDKKIRLTTELDMAKKSEKESMENLKNQLIELGYKEEEIDLSPKGLEKIVNETMEKVNGATMEMDKALSEVGA